MSSSFLDIFYLHHFQLNHMNQSLLLTVGALQREIKKGGVFMYLHIRLFMTDGAGKQIGFPFFTIHSDILLQF